MTEKLHFQRLRRNRKYSWLRDLLSENFINQSDLILPIFIIEGSNLKQEIKNLPDIYRFSIDLAVKQSQIAHQKGIKAIMIFPVVEKNLKTADGIEALNKNNLICRAVKEIKKYCPEIGIICDVALDPYTNHGHDGVLDENGDVDNDKTLEILCKQALIQCEAGCDIIAPSDMMDGRVLKIRQSLDLNGFYSVPIMSYAAKYCSNFYGAFRSAIGSIDNLKQADKKTYQMDFRNSKEAIREILQDEKEGADMIIIKPATHYLDIICKASRKTNLPIIAYQVSSEYAMLKFAANNGVFDYKSALQESLIAIKRAGACAIITYGALDL
jgi:porphobilinogen synthase